MSLFSKDHQHSLEEVARVIRGDPATREKLLNRLLYFSYASAVIGWMGLIGFLMFLIH